MSSVSDCQLINASIVCEDIRHGALNPQSSYYKAVQLDPAVKPIICEAGIDNIHAGFVGKVQTGETLVVLRGTYTHFEILETINRLFESLSAARLANREREDLFATAINRLEQLRGYVQEIVGLRDKETQGIKDFIKSILDWLNDARYWPKQWKINGTVVGQVETGFADAVTSLWDQLSAALDSVTAADSPQIIVTGHSKGAAMTYPTATLVNTKYESMPIKVHCFASPYCGDDDFKAYYNGLNTIRSTQRYQNKYDIVPFLPTTDMIHAIKDYVDKTLPDTPAYLALKLVLEILLLLHPEAPYVRIGDLNYLDGDCAIFHGTEGQDMADLALWQAVKQNKWREIADAHAAKGQYSSCICPKDC